MDWDEPLAKKSTGAQIGEDLVRLSVGELKQRIKDLEAEIVRVAAELKTKEARAAAAAAIFKD